MSQDKCEQLEGLLVDYADGLLDGEEAAEVAGHIEQCLACRDKVEALDESLELARVIWRDNLDESTSRSAVRPSLARVLMRRWPAVAAAAVVVFAVAVISHRRPMAGPAGPQLTAEQVEAQIMAEGSAARLLAAAEILARKPHARELARSQYRYILEYYPETEAAVQARTKTQ